MWFESNAWSFRGQPRAGSWSVEEGRNHMCINDQNAMCIRSILVSRVKGRGVTGICSRLEDDHRSALRSGADCPSHVVNFFRSDERNSLFCTAPVFRFKTRDNWYYVHPVSLSRFFRISGEMVVDSIVVVKIKQFLTSSL